MIIKHGTTRYLYPTSEAIRCGVRSTYRDRRATDKEYPRWQPLGGEPAQRRVARDEVAHFLLAMLVELDRLPGADARALTEGTQR